MNALEKASIIIKHVDELGDEAATKSLYKKVWNEIKLTKKNRVQYIVSTIIAVIISIVVSFSYKTPEKMHDIVSLFIEIILAFMAIIFGAYSIFQALLSDSLLKTLAVDRSNSLRECNLTFLNLLWIYLFDVVLCTVVKVILMCFPNDFIIAKSIATSNIVSVIMCFPFIFFNILIILEMRNFIVNMFKLFNTYNRVKMNDYLHEMYGKEIEPNNEEREN